MFEPQIENNRSLETMLTEPVNAQGLMLVGYQRFNDGGTFFSDRVHEDLATADFVCNDPEDRWMLMGRGKWQVNNNPVDKWGDVREAIQYINIFLEKMDGVTWAQNENINKMFADRLKGESYALRAILNYFFLRAHAGVAGGQLLGVPIVTASENVNSDFNIPRQPFQVCVDQVFSDFEEALKYLPETYDDHTDAQVPEEYKALGIKGADYNRVYGQYMKGRIDATIVKAMRAKFALMCASPAFSKGCNVTWQQAADYAAQVVGGKSVVPNGHTWYNHTDEINALKDGDCPPEAIWRGDRTGDDNRDFEASCFPPTLYGKGFINPTQNLVDAFPAANGYPISDPNSNYDKTKPFENRDPRLDLYIIHDGSVLRETTINTGSASTTRDGINSTDASKSITGYYLRKFMNEECSPDPSNPQGRRHFKPRIRYTEMFLVYAEALNEAGNTAKAAEIMKEIRDRALGPGKDQYLPTISGNQAKMRELIHNERRIELMGENFRFWDLRRWEEPINETIYGYDADRGSKMSVGELNYGSHMNYGPIPESELLKWSNLVQNDGWQ
jgi:hypothetical protein